MRLLILTISVILITACSVEPGSEQWCKAKSDQSKSEWTTDDAKIYTMHCIFDSQTIGSKEWCENLSDKPKGEWTTNEAADYAKHCII